MRDVILLHPTDSVCVAARDLAAGATVELPDGRLRLLDDVSQGHKIARTAIQPGEPVLKWGQTIGFATCPIEPGRWVHSHNMAIGALAQEYEKSTAVPDDPPPRTGYTFQGYRRADGRAGTRNYIAILSNVNCSASVARHVAARFTPERLRDFPHVDGVLAFSHGSGCGMEFGGEHHQILNRVMGGMARHPNIGGYVLVGLGCETGTIGSSHRGSKAGADRRRAARRPAPAHRRPIVLSMQDLGGTQKTIDEAERLVETLLPQVNAARRETIPASEIVLGLNCGGSDGNSGITANAALGVASDRLVACGGTTILGETTEIYGAEQLLTRQGADARGGRQADRADSLVGMVRGSVWLHARQQSLAGEQGRRPDDDLRKVAGRDRQGGNDGAQRRGPVRRAGALPRLGGHGHAGIGPGQRHRNRGRRGQRDGFHHRAGKLLRVQADAGAQDREQHGDVRADARRHGRRRGDDPEPGAERGGSRRGNLRADSGNRQRRTPKSEQLGLGDEEFQPWILGPVL